MYIQTLPLGDLQTNCYLISKEESGPLVVIDPGGDADMIVQAIAGREVAAVLLTHGHFDHTGALHAFSEVPIYIHSLDKPMLTDSHFSFGSFAGDHRPRPDASHLVAEGDVLHLAGLEIKVLHTPGHTRGSVCYQVGEELFTGDTLFKGDYGRTDLPGGSEEQMRASLRRLFTLSGSKVHPGHGPGDRIK